MAQFMGTLQGQRGPTSRLGSKKSGLQANINGWHGGVFVSLFVGDNGEDCARIVLTNGSGGDSGPCVVVYYGPLNGDARTMIQTVEGWAEEGPKS